MRIARKTKKRIIKTFGRGTYRGIKLQCLNIVPTEDNKGCRIIQGPQNGVNEFYMLNAYTRGVMLKKTY